MRLLVAAAAAVAAGLSGCADADKPSGEIEIVGNTEDLQVGQTVNLNWSSKEAVRVWIRAVVDGKEGPMLDAAGFGPSGSTSFVIGPDAVTLAEDDDADIKFQLLARESDDAEFATLDETDQVEVALAQP
jgi:hypothetical protein